MYVILIEACSFIQFNLLLFFSADASSLMKMIVWWAMTLSTTVSEFNYPWEDRINDGNISCSFIELMCLWADVSCKCLV